MIFAYTLGLVSRQYESIWEKVTKAPIDNIFDDNLAVELQGQVCLEWAEEMMQQPNKTIRDAAKQAHEEYSSSNTKLFVYGTEVEDFHTLNKEYIFTLNVCATQELHRRIETQSVLLKSQDDRIKDLETKVAMLMSNT